MPPLPPPPALEADAAAELEARRCGRRANFRNPSWEAPNGFIVWDMGRDSLDAHCHWPAHENKKNPCRLNRKHRDMPDKQTSQGRPLGLEFLWLELAPQYLTRELHCNAFQKAKQTDEDLERLAHPHRSEARIRHKDDPLLTDLFALERKKYTGEGEEPLGLP
jgi:hypothetical protein